MITCPKCLKTKANSKFTKPDAKAWTDKLSWCRDCKKEYQKLYAKARRADTKKNEKGRFRHYGITEDDYNQILAIQNGVCAGCGRSPNPKIRLNIDHIHQPSESKRQPWERLLMVRGLLCFLCNKTLGILKDRSETLYNLYRYLEDPPARNIIMTRHTKILNYIEDLETKKKSKSNGKSIK